MSVPPSIRRASSRDAPTLSALHIGCFDASWSVESFETLLQADNVLGLVASRGAVDIAFVLIRTAADEAEILTLGTLASARRQGIARILVVTAAEHAYARGATKMYLEVSERNTAAAALYHGLGFSAVGSRNAYYRGRHGNEDAILLAAALPLCE